MGADFSSYTILNPYNTISGDATLNGWCLKTGNTVPVTAKLKIFRVNGSNYDFVAESSTIDCAVANTVYSGTCNISVLAGDLVGIYFSSGTVALANSAEKSKYHSGDVITNTAIGSWSVFFGDYKLILYTSDNYSFNLDEVYVDINKADDTGTGTSWATAKKTMKAGWDILNSAGTMHVATGDYSGQTGITYNRSWTLSPEDPNVTGSKSVTIPPVARKPYLSLSRSLRLEHYPPTTSICGTSALEWWCG